MRIDRSLLAIGMSALMVMAHAFEPGHERICTPSADGHTFECHDKSADSAAESQPNKLEPAAIAPAPVADPVATRTSAATTATPAPKPAASKLPNYLMQNPSAVAPNHDLEPATAVARQPASTGQAAPAVQTATADVSPAAAQAEPIEPADAGHAQGVEEPAVEAAPKPTPTPQATAATSAQAVAGLVQESAPPTPSALASHTASADLPDASAFRTLPASHYTLVLASVRDPAALEPLISTLDVRPGQLYLLKLGMPDGDWYSLCWSDFADLDAARAARADLPADAPISSGWPRRIGLLQKELAR